MEINVNTNTDAVSSHWGGGGDHHHHHHHQPQVDVGDVINIASYTAQVAHANMAQPPPPGQYYDGHHNHHHGHHGHHNGGHHGHRGRRGSSSSSDENDAQRWQRHQMGGHRGQPGYQVGILVVNITPEMYDVHIKRQLVCSKVTGFISLAVQVGNIIFQFTSGNEMYWLAAFPIIFTIIILSHLAIIGKPIEELKRIHTQFKGRIICEIILSILLFIGNILTMVFSINGIFFQRDLNFGVIPFTIFSIMTYMFHCGSFWAAFNMLSRQAFVANRANNPLLPPPAQPYPAQPPPPQQPAAAYPPGYQVPPPQGYGYAPGTQQPPQGYAQPPNQYLPPTGQTYQQPPPPGAYPPNMPPNAPAAPYQPPAFSAPQPYIPPAYNPQPYGMGIQPSQQQVTGVPLVMPPNAEDVFKQGSNNFVAAMPPQPFAPQNQPDMGKTNYM